MANKHGVFIYEEGTTIAVPQESSAGMPVVIGTAPVNMMDDPSAAVNVPIYASSAKEAMQQLGYSTDFDSYTLCQAMYITSNLYQISPVVYINVLDPARHKKALSVTVPVSDMQAVVEKEGVIKSGLTVVKALTAEAGAAEGTASGDGANLDADDGETQTTTQGETESAALAEGTDYALSFDTDGHLVITLISGGAAADATGLVVTGYQLDPSAVTKDDIIGAVDVDTGKETGMEVIRQVYPKFGVVPGILVAPGWSQIPEVGITLSAKAVNINGVFKAMAYIDLPCDENGAKKYTDCKAVKESCGFNSEFAYVLWPKVQVGELTFPYSIVAAARTAYLDGTNEDVPSQSPSNKGLAITATVLADGTEVVLDQDQATAVGEYGVATAVNLNGFRMWGNHTACYPGSTDAKDIWINVRRMFSWQGNNFILTYTSKVDNNMDRKLIDSIIDSENIRCAAYAPKHWAGASIEYLESDNAGTDILAGHVTFRQHIAPYTPAETIDNILNYDIDMLQAALTGGGE